MINILKWISRFTWEIIQTMIGFIFFIFIKIINKESKTEVYKNTFFTQTKNSGVSLGAFIFGTSAETYKEYGWGDGLEQAELTKRHEYGHSIQSMILGPLYLILIGLPSAFFNLLTRMGKLANNSYYTRYPEDWADRLVNIERNI